MRQLSAMQVASFKKGSLGDVLQVGELTFKNKLRLVLFKSIPLENNLRVKMIEWNIIYRYIVIYRYIIIIIYYI